MVAALSEDDDRSEDDQYYAEDDGDGEVEGENYGWLDEASDLSSPKSSSKNFDCESGDEVEEIPESEGGGGKQPVNNKSGSTTESYSSAAQEEEESDILKDIANGNVVMNKLSPTDSESFTTSEQLTQRFVDIYVSEGRSTNGNGD